MTLEEFINKVTEEIKNYLPAEYADGEIYCQFHDRSG